MSVRGDDGVAGAIAERGPNENLIGMHNSRRALGTPALVLDLDAVEANIASMAEHARRFGYSLRPVAKIHKSTEIARRQIEAGAPGVCCSTLREAEAMIDAEIPGVLLFAPVVNEPKLERLTALNSRANGLIVVADDAAHIQRFAEVARRSGRRLSILIDVEVGGRRTGVDDPNRVVQLARLAMESEWLDYEGVQGYVGHHQKIVDYEERRARSTVLLQPLLRVLDALHAADLEPQVISGGGTGTHDFDADVGGFTELQVGTYVLMDAGYSQVVMRSDEPHPFRPALSVSATVISTAKPGLAITDAGMKQLDGALEPPILHGAPTGASYSLVGDDMGRIDFSRREKGLELGDIVEVMPPRCYQTLIMHEQYHVVRGDELVDIWSIEARSSW